MRRYVIHFWIGLVLCLAMAAPGVAHAFGATECAASRFGSDLVCSANDVQITSISVVGGPASCTGGQTVTLDLDLVVQFATPARWDVGIFISNDGKDGLATPANGGAASCSTSILPLTSPFQNLDSNGGSDTCGDGSNNLNGTLRMSNVTVQCQSQSNNGQLYIPFVVSWDNQASPTGATCTSNLDPVPNTKSKCNAPTIAQGSVNVIALPSISKTDGITGITPGEATTYTVTIANSTGITLSTANGNAAVFRDPAVSDLTVSGLSCAALGAATCPAAASLTVAAMQGGGITIPSMADGSSVVFTVSAQLTGTPTGTLTNVATVTANGQTSSAADANTIDYPSLTNVKTVSVISDPINGTTNPKFIPGAEVLYNVRVSNAGAGTVNRDVMFVTDPIPANTELYVGDVGGAGSGPVSFVDGSPSSNLTYGFTSLANTGDDLAFSNNGGSSYSYTPVPDASGYDSAVTHIRVYPKGKMAAWSGSGGYPHFALGFKVRIR